MEAPSLKQSLRRSTVAEQGALQVSKWIDVQALLDPSELRALFESVEVFGIYNCSGVHASQEEQISLASYIEWYTHYIEALQANKLSEDPALTSRLNVAITTSTDALFAMGVGEQRQIVRPCRPVLQIQPAALSFSIDDHKFYTRVLGQDCISWGLQFSYPQLYQNPETQLIESIDRSERFPNTQLFQSLRRWIRHNTQPTPFQYEGVRINSPVRIGKSCFAWVNTHPQLRSRDLSVTV